MPFQLHRAFAVSRGCRSYVIPSFLVLFLLLFALGAGVLAYRALASLRDGTGTSSSLSGTPSAGAPGATTVPGYHPQLNDDLESVSMVSSSEGWAVGSTNVSGQLYESLILHYTGHLWEQVTAPSNAELQAQSTGLQQISMVSASEGWAVGHLEWDTTQPDGSTDAAFILHYQQGTWKLQETFPGALQSLWMLSSTDGWAVGSEGTEIGQSVMLHYDGQSWNPVDVPGAGLASVVMATPTNGWAFGFSAGKYAGQFSGLLLHYTGSTWGSVALPGIDTFIALTMASPSDGWLVGIQTSSPSTSQSLDSPIFAHYHGGAWTVVKTPVTANPNASVTSLALTSTSEGWAVGTLQAQGSAPDQASTLYLHFHQGQWTPVTGPDAGWINSLALVSGSEGWGVGKGGVIVHEENGVWSLVTGTPSQ